MTDPKDLVLSYNAYNGLVGVLGPLDKQREAIINFFDEAAASRCEPAIRDIRDKLDLTFRCIGGASNTLSDIQFFRFLVQAGISVDKPDTLVNVGRENVAAAAPNSTEPHTSSVPRAAPPAKVAVQLCRDIFHYVLQGHSVMGPKEFVHALIHLVVCISGEAIASPGGRARCPRLLGYFIETFLGRYLEERATTYPFPKKYFAECLNVARVLWRHSAELELVYDRFAPCFEGCPTNDVGMAFSAFVNLFSTFGIVPGIPVETMRRIFDASRLQSEECCLNSSTEDQHQEPQSRTLQFAQFVEAVARIACEYLSDDSFARWRTLESKVEHFLSSSFAAGFRSVWGRSPHVEPDTVITPQITSVLPGEFTADGGMMTVWGSYFGAYGRGVWVAASFSKKPFRIESVPAHTQLEISIPPVNSTRWMQCRLTLSEDDEKQLVVCATHWTAPIRIAVSNAPEELPFFSCTYEAAIYSHELQPFGLGAATVASMKTAFHRGCAHSSAFNRSFLYEPDWTWLCRTYKFEFGPYNSEALFGAAKRGKSAELEAALFSSFARPWSRDGSTRPSLRFTDFTEVIIRVALSQGHPMDDTENVISRMFLVNAPLEDSTTVSPGPFSIPQRTTRDIVDSPAPSSQLSFGTSRKHLPDIGSLAARHALANAEHCRKVIADLRGKISNKDKELDDWKAVREQLCERIHEIRTFLDVILGHAALQAQGDLPENAQKNVVEAYRATLEASCAEVIQVLMHPDALGAAVQPHERTAAVEEASSCRSPCSPPVRVETPTSTAQYRTQSPAFLDIPAFQRRLETAIQRAVQRGSETLVVRGNLSLTRQRIEELMESHALLEKSESAAWEGCSRLKAEYEQLQESTSSTQSRMIEEIAARDHQIEELQSAANNLRGELREKAKELGKAKQLAEKNSRIRRVSESLLANKEDQHEKGRSHEQQQPMAQKATDKRIQMYQLMQKKTELDASKKECEQLRQQCNIHKIDCDTLQSEVQQLRDRVLELEIQANEKAVENTTSDFTALEQPESPPQPPRVHASDTGTSPEATKLKKVGRGRRPRGVTMIERPTHVVGVTSTLRGVRSESPGASPSKAHPTVGQTFTEEPKDEAPPTGAKGMAEGDQALSAPPVAAAANQKRSPVTVALFVTVASQTIQMESEIEQGASTSPAPDPRCEMKSVACETDPLYHSPPSAPTTSTQQTQQPHKQSLQPITAAGQSPHCRLLPIAAQMKYSCSALRDSLHAVRAVLKINASWLFPTHRDPVADRLVQSLLQRAEHEDRSHPLLVPAVQPAARPQVEGVFHETEVVEAAPPPPIQDLARKIIAPAQQQQQQQQLGDAALPTPSLLLHVEPPAFPQESLVTQPLPNDVVPERTPKVQTFRAMSTPTALPCSLSEQLTGIASIQAADVAEGPSGSTSDGDSLVSAALNAQPTDTNSCVTAGEDFTSTKLLLLASEFVEQSSVESPKSLIVATPSGEPRRQIPTASEVKKAIGSALRAATERPTMNSRAPARPPAGTADLPDPLIVRPTKKPTTENAQVQFSAVKPQQERRTSRQSQRSQGEVAAAPIAAEKISAAQKSSPAPISHQSETVSWVHLAVPLRPMQQHPPLANPDAAPKAAVASTVHSADYSKLPADFILQPDVLSDVHRVSSASGKGMAAPTKPSSEPQEPVPQREVPQSGSHCDDVGSSVLVINGERICGRGGEEGSEGRGQEMTAQQREGVIAALLAEGTSWMLGHVSIPAKHPARTDLAKARYNDVVVDAEGRLRVLPRGQPEVMEQQHRPRPPPQHTPNILIPATKTPSLEGHQLPATGTAQSASEYQALLRAALRSAKAQRGPSVPAPMKPRTATAGARRVVPNPSLPQPSRLIGATTHSFPVQKIPQAAPTLAIHPPSFISSAS